MVSAAASSGSWPPSQPDWNNLSVLQRNRLPGRSYFFPYDSPDLALSGDPAKASALLLSGTWKFHLAQNPYLSPPNFHEPLFDVSQWADIQVPGMWQLQGFSKPVYTNTNYHFPVDPPNVPVEGNETGAYVKDFVIPKKFAEKQIRLRFEGVDAAYHVFVNGKEVGYSQGSRNPAEFDISKFVTGGSVIEKLAVRVYRFCDGSYLEDQDQWRTSGIFRDVWLIAFGQKRIDDIFVKTDLDENYENATLHVDLKVVGKGDVEVQLNDKGGKEVARKRVQADGDIIVNFGSLPDLKKWTAETPNLYTLLVTFSGQSIVQRIGFRKTEIKNGIFVVNGKRIVFRGANRHEHHPRHGRAVPYDFMRQDLLTMKQYNINAIRTSHQPSDPRLYDLANELGLWVMDEADLECHGFVSVEEDALLPADRQRSYEERKAMTHKDAGNWTSEMPEWEASYVDRAQQLVLRDKNHPSVVMWSLGNEAFYGRNFQAMYDWMRAYDPSRFVHYEGDQDARTVDVYSRMYPSVDEIINDFGKAESFAKPLVLCEFIHAMGTGPGNIKEYIDAFYKYPRLQGGFVWEWANHGLLTKTKDGEPFYGYGGDFGEDVHDYNFVMDGVVKSDHTPGPGLVEYGKAIEPVQLIEGSSIDNAQIINRYDHVTLDHLVAVATSHGKNLVRTAIEVPKGVQPGQTAKLDLSALTGLVSDPGILTVNFYSEEVAKSEQPDPLRMPSVAWFQMVIKPLTSFSPNVLPAAVSTFIVNSQGDKLSVGSEDTQQRLVFSLSQGSLIEFVKDGQQTLASAPELTFYRPLTDNDRPQDGVHWLAKHVHQLRKRTSSVTWKTSTSSVEIKIKQTIAPPVLAWRVDLETIYTIYVPQKPTAGKALVLKIEVRGKPGGTLPPATIPRIGLSFSLKPTFTIASWYGRGPSQSYNDMKLSQPLDYHTLPIESLFQSPEFPQEAGNRTDVQYVEFSSDNASSLALSASEGKNTLTAVFQDSPGNFSASHFKEADIDAATHPWELEKKKTEEVNVKLDWRHHGLGTGSCGPKTLDAYALKLEPFQHSVYLF